MSKFKNIFSNYKVLLTAFIVVAILASMQSYFGSAKAFIEGGPLYTHYNNYIIFKSSFFHLIDGKDLYQLHPSDHFDLYKYSPSFALLFAPLALLPDLIGLSIWNLLNALILLWAVWNLPKLDNRKKGFILAFVFIEMISSLQNSQSNGMIAGLLVGAFVFFEKEKFLWGTLFLVLSFFIKIFGIVGFAICLLYADKKKIAAYSIFWFLLIGFLPVIVVGWEQFVFLYESWGRMLGEDHSSSYGLSVMGWLETWFGWRANKLMIVAIGVAIFCLPLLQWKKYQQYTFRLLVVASVLIWVVIFNHKAESPTFVIAITGVAIWFFSQKNNKLNTFLLILSFLLTILSPTDIFPRAIREQYVIPYVLKAVPCILIWIKLIWDMMKSEVRSWESEVGSSLL